MDVYHEGMTDPVDGYIGFLDVFEINPVHAETRNTLHFHPELAESDAT